ncbi:MAG: extracellular solute-binding protein, partial [Acidimicrobiia bacterium]|nr:extracellular solute-binding protein [Acidimicrobiia bacterium]
MRTQRWLPAMAAFAMLVAACSGGDGSATTQATDQTTSPEPNQTTTTLSDTATTVATGALEGAALKLWGWSSSDAENQALSDLVASFNEETGAAAEFQPQAEYDATLQAALAGGEPPDVFYVDSFKLPDLASEGILAPIPDGAVDDPSDIYPALRDAFTFDGTWFCPPKDFSTLALVYDPAALEDAGVAVPTTWEELSVAAATLTTGTVEEIAAGTGQAGLAMGVEYPRWGVFLFQNGVALTDDAVTEVALDNDQARESLQFVADLYASGAAIKPQSVDAGWAGEAFGQGKAAMTIEGNWIVGYLQDTFPDKQFAVAELPVGPAGPGTFAFTVCYGVPQNAANPDASWALVNYLTDAKGALAWTSAFNVMPARASISDDWLSPRPELQPFLDGAEYARRWALKPGANDLVGVFNEQ